MTLLPFQLKEMVLGIISGESSSVARALTLCDSNGNSSSEKLLKKIYPYGGNSRVVGITGSTGVGKSSLIFQLTKILRKRNRTVGILSIDPTSPVSHGSFLGDRLRMQELGLDKGVFIRSIAGGTDSRDSLTRKIFSLLHVLEASGKHIVFIETMGSGQDDCLITKVAQTTLYVTIPTLGDEIQALKAGVAEVADMLVINKADDPAKDKAIAWWKNVIAMDEKKTGAWKSHVLAANSITGEGADQILSAIDVHERHMKDSGEWERRKKEAIREEVRMLLLEKLLKEMTAAKINEKDISELLERKNDPLNYVETILRKRRR